MLNPLLFCYHTTGDAVPGVSGGIGFHVVGLCMDKQRRSPIAENGVAVISPIHVFVHDLCLRLALCVNGDILHVAGVVAFRILKPVPRLRKTLPHESHARHGRLHSRRDRFGTIRADFVGDLRFRVRSQVILEGLPIAPLILYLFARQTDWQQSL